MPRIRSVHPGLFTDEAFAGLSDAAQIFVIGLWTECDDQGVFEWKPITLRMRLRPTKDGSVEPLLAELEAANLIRSFEHDARKYGAVRNFRKFQRPKKPNSIHLLPSEFRTYVGSVPPSSEPRDDERPPIPQKGEIAPQMEDGGGEEEKKGSEAKASGTPSAPVDEREKLFSEGLRAVKRITGQPERNARALIGRWLKVTGDDCLTVGRLIEDAERDKRADPVAWIEAHFKPRPAGGAPPGAKINPDGTFERWAL